MFGLFFVPAALTLLAALLYCDWRSLKTRRIVFKGCLSALFVVAALLQPRPVPAYFHWLLGGLVAGLAGDLCLAFPGPLAFRLGLLSFLGGHLFYLAAFAGLTTPQGWLSLLTILPCGPSAAAFLWLRPHLGRMRIPVIAYLAIITLMLASACAVVGEEGIPLAGRLYVGTGALCFYLSDLFVARQRFVTEAFPNRLAGLPLYYLGQFLLAFSIGLVG